MMVREERNSLSAPISGANTVAESSIGPATLSPPAFALTTGALQMKPAQPETSESEEQVGEMMQMRQVDGAAGDEDRGSSGINVVVQRQVAEDETSRENARTSAALARNLTSFAEIARSTAISEAQDRSVTYINRVYEDGMRANGGMLGQTADQLGLASRSLRYGRTAHSWGSAAVHLLSMGIAIRNLDSAMRDSREAGSAATVTRASVRLTECADAVAEFIGDLPIPHGWKESLQVLVQSAGSLGSAIGHQLGVRLSRADSIQGGGGQQERGWGATRMHDPAFTSGVLQPAMERLGIPYLSVGRPEDQAVSQRIVEEQMGDFFERTHSFLETEMAGPQRGTIDSILESLGIVDFGGTSNPWTGQEYGALANLNNVRTHLISIKEGAVQNGTEINVLYYMLKKGLVEFDRAIARTWYPYLHPRFPHSGQFIAQHLQNCISNGDGVCGSSRLRI